MFSINAILLNSKNRIKDNSGKRFSQNFNEKLIISYMTNEINLIYLIAKNMTGQFRDHIFKHEIDLIGWIEISLFVVTVNLNSLIVLSKS